MPVTDKGMTVIYSKCKKVQQKQTAVSYTHLDVYKRQTQKLSQQMDS